MDSTFWICAKCHGIYEGSEPLPDNCCAKGGVHQPAVLPGQQAPEPLKLEMPPYLFTTDDAEDDVQHGWVTCKKCRVLFLPFDSRLQTSTPFLHSEYCVVKAAEQPPAIIQEPPKAELVATFDEDEIPSVEDEIAYMPAPSEEAQSAKTKAVDTSAQKSAETKSKDEKPPAKKPQYPHEPVGIRYGIPRTTVRQTWAFKSCNACGSLYYEGQVVGQSTSQGGACAFSNPDSEDDKQKYVDLPAGLAGDFGHAQNANYYIVEFKANGSEQGSEMDNI